ncbi:FMN-dependent NADH-azoreductase [Erythrobacter aureus]|uniref:FMN dependent NADH:quinone oxidoreductase n=1 Tax=Erythrobacter aureus TaxID=2182384 RepID=A0A345YBJ4_9SPHN|nr:NAD(P)H-dependent oxidoreductase [Erythrobacter aureus]AXK41296.1 NAD(P)H dehydrogenase [Erythrobacter aureus]
MSNVLIVDASARSASSHFASFGSHTRRLSLKFAETWRCRCPGATILHREIGLLPPTPVDPDWIHAAFTPEQDRSFWMQQRLAESDKLVDELIASDIIVIASPMYNFGVPAQLKAYIDNVVRVGRTFGFDRNREDEPYWPLLKDDNKTLVVLSSRGDHGYDDASRLKNQNHVEPGIVTPLSYLGIEKHHYIAIEFDEFADDRLEASIARAEQEVEALAAELAAQ